MRTTTVLVVGLGLFSCKDLLEVRPDNALEPDQVYRDKFDADAAVVGVYGQFLDLAERYVVMNELRADLMDVTGNAEEDLIQLNNHMVTPENTYANPAPYYKLIISCNDVLRNFELMVEENRMDRQEFGERYSDIATLRSWVYLQAAIHYGRVPYIDDQLATIKDARDLERFPYRTLEEIVPILIGVMESLPHMASYSDLVTLNRTIDGFATNKFFINKRTLLGDLYLWNKQYREAASQYKRVMEGPNPGVSEFDSYKVKFADVATNNDLSVGYVRFKDQDFNSLIDNNTQGWKSMFIRNPDALFNSEVIWFLPFDRAFEPKTPFVKLFSNVGGDYLVKPSRFVIDSLWEKQVQRNGFPWDQRGRWSWQNVAGQPVIMKYIYNFNPTTPLEASGKWLLYRAALLHLRFAEAANRDGQEKIAWSLLNNGREAYNDPAITDVTREYDTFQPFPYDFAYRSTNTPFFRDLWHRSDGIRGRANLTFLQIPTALQGDQRMLHVENKLLEEGAMELAFEGNRWPDLLRIAMRRRGTDPNFLARHVARKLRAAGNPNAEAVYAKLQNPDNWFLPVRWEQGAN